jgi:undecaprenyl diphosphate synthase
MGLISGLYEWKLKNTLRKHKLPSNIVLALAESDLLTDTDFEKLLSFAYWCDEYGINTLTVYVSIIEAEEELSTKICDKFARELPSKLLDVTPNVSVITRGDREIQKSVSGGMRVDISLGYSGKYELTHAMKELMKKVDSGRLAPDDIDEKAIESHLLFKFEPDLVVRAGGKRLTDFLIWQSVYSELYFTDVNWQDLRKVDFLRALRDYQKRQRRYGK